MTNVNEERETAEEAYAYTPGLKVKRGIALFKTRTLPLPGEVLVEKGANVDFDTIVLRTRVPGRPTMMKLNEILDIKPEDIPAFMVKKEGDSVEEGEIIARYAPFFGLFKKLAKSPTKGVIEAVSDITGQVVIREPPSPVEVKAYVPGKIAEIFPRTGVSIETHAAYVQGIFGIGGETHGKLLVVAASTDEVLTADMITSDHKGGILVGGSLVTSDAIRKARDVGVRGIIVGGIKQVDLSECLGYQIGVAITGQEDINITVIITEGFGKMSMSGRTFSMLKDFEGHEIAVNGATQIRAGVIRPEIIVPYEKHGLESDTEELTRGMRPGTPVRIIGEPYFGRIGVVASLPVQLQSGETESPVRVLVVKLEEGDVTVPRANVEIIEE